MRVLTLCALALWGVSCADSCAKRPLHYAVQTCQVDGVCTFTLADGSSFEVMVVDQNGDAVRRAEAFLLADEEDLVLTARDGDDNERAVGVLGAPLERIQDFAFRAVSDTNEHSEQQGAQRPLLLTLTQAASAGLAVERLATLPGLLGDDANRSRLCLRPESSAEILRFPESAIFVAPGQASLVAGRVTDAVMLSSELEVGEIIDRYVAPRLGQRSEYQVLLLNSPEVFAEAAGNSDAGLSQLSAWIDQAPVWVVLNAACDDPEGRARACAPSCEGRACGHDGCGGRCQPGCAQGQRCDDASGVCHGICEPGCDGRSCGPDGCGGLCAPGCSADQLCDSELGRCVDICTPQCQNRSCGDDGCGGSCDPGCGRGQSCNLETGQCEDRCYPSCQGRSCGPDGCGGECQPGCGAGETCNVASGQCQLVCTVECAGRVCGPDGCGGECGPGCGIGHECEPLSGQCEPVQLELGWVTIPAGEFEMGCSPRDQACALDEEPARTVTVAAFELMAAEISQTQFAAVMGFNPSARGDCPDCPADSVRWQEAHDFCAAVGGRLPSEAEWEYAARAGSDASYVCGDTAACLGPHAWTAANAGGETQPVAATVANAFGLHDMIGNVWEWVADWYHVGGYAGAPQDAQVWPCSDCTRHVARGHSYSGADPRVSARRPLPLQSAYSGDGARCARDLTAP